MRGTIHYGEPKERIFNKAQQDPLTDVLIVGRDPSGKIVGWTNLDQANTDAFLKEAAPELVE